MTATLPNIRAIVFDLDGVLIDSMPCHRAAFEEVFHPFGVRDFNYSEWAGWRTADVVQAVLRQSGCELTPEKVAEVASRKSALAREKMAATNPVDPDCLAVLNELASGYVLGLASSGSRQSVHQFLSTNHCGHLFQSVLTGDNVSRAKPDPEIYSRTFSALTISPVGCVVVEDAIAGIQAANAAGAGAVVGISGTCSSHQLFEAGATHVIVRLAELPTLLVSLHEHAHSH